MLFRGGTCREVHYRHLKNVPTPKGPLLMRCSDGLPHYSNLTMNPIKVACMQDFQWGNYSTLESINQTLINVMIWKEMNVCFKSDCFHRTLKYCTYSAGFLVRFFYPSLSAAHTKMIMTPYWKNVRRITFTLKAQNFWSSSIKNVKTFSVKSVNLCWWLSVSWGEELFLSFSTFSNSDF